MKVVSPGAWIAHVTHLHCVPGLGTLAQHHQPPWCEAFVLPRGPGRLLGISVLLLINIAQSCRGFFLGFSDFQSYIASDDPVARLALGLFVVSKIGTIEEKIWFASRVFIRARKL